MPVKLLLSACLLAAAPAAALAAPVILVLGDSISAAYGIDRDQGWVSMLQRRLRDKSYDYEVVNASVSGETANGALARLDRELDRHRPELVIIELGGNDGLRGTPPDRIEADLGAIVERIKGRGAKPLLAGMELPPNYGAAYTRAFQRAYRRVAERQRVPLIPFLLAGIARDRANFQPDGIHPTAAAQPALLDAVWPQLEPLLRRASGTR
jgi:acyl-CoA thioesterase-1